MDIKWEHLIMIFIGAILFALAMTYTQNPMQAIVPFILGILLVYLGIRLHNKDKKKKN